jgi:malate dehydrogenase
VTPTGEGDTHSVAICSKGDYGVEAGLMSSFPIRTHRDGSLEVVKNLQIGEFSRSRIDSSIAELQEERALVRDLLG